ncbi:MAG: hypothetical protein PHW76_09120 [Alphaproteobacteria bacterium]|nr:hypothetical protein [Alphaproteobacteria bacterium]
MAFGDVRKKLSDFPFSPRQQEALVSLGAISDKLKEHRSVVQLGELISHDMETIKELRHKDVKALPSWGIHFAKSAFNVAKSDPLTVLSTLSICLASSEAKAGLLKGAMLVAGPGAVVLAPVASAAVAFTLSGFLGLNKEIKAIASNRSVSAKEVFLNDVLHNKRSFNGNRTATEFVLDRGIAAAYNSMKVCLVVGALGEAIKAIHPAVAQSAVAPPGDYFADPKAPHITEVGKISVTEVTPIQATDAESGAHIANVAMLHANDAGTLNVSNVSPLQATDAESGAHIANVAMLHANDAGTLNVSNVSPFQAIESTPSASDVVMVQAREVEKIPVIDARITDYRIASHPLPEPSATGSSQGGWQGSFSTLKKHLEAALSPKETTEPVRPGAGGGAPPSSTFTPL